jgi:hypothetical protein
MEHGADQHLSNPVTPQVAEQIAERMGHECTHDHQDQSKHAHQQAGYRLAVQSTLPSTSNTLAPPGESI